MSSLKRYRKSGKDRISNLPESVVSHILSRLPTNDAIRTCVLSKDWEFKWTSIYNIDIEDRWVVPGKRDMTTTFDNHVERIILLLHNIRSFRLQWEDYYNSSRMPTWISALLRQNVRSLELIGPDTEDRFLLPRNFLNSTSLRKLKLDISCTFKVPSSNCFPKLASLDLYGVDIRNELSCTNTLVFTFPVLKTLELKQCKWLNVKFVHINVPALTNFLSDTSVDAKVDEYSIKILGDKLTNFESSGPENLILTGSSVVRATLHNDAELFPLHLPEKSGLQVRSLFKSFQRLEKLDLSGWTTEAIAQSNGEFSLPKLQRLTLRSRTDIKALFELLHASPSLKSLVVQMLIFPDNYDYDAVESIPACLANQLEEVELTYDIDVPISDQFHLAKFLLKNGLGLKMFHIHADRYMKREVAEFVSNFSRGSNGLAFVVY